MIWALERAFSYIFFCSEKEQKKDAALIPSAKKGIVKPARRCAELVEVCRRRPPCRFKIKNI